MSLRWKIAGALAALAGIVVSLAAAGAYLTSARQLDQSVDQTLVAQASTAVMRSRSPSRPDAGRAGGGRTLVTRCPEPEQLRSLRSAQLLVAGEVTSCIDGGGSIDVTSADQKIAAGGDGDDDGDEAHGDLTPYLLRTGRVDGEPARIVTMALPQGGAIQLARDVDESGRVLEGLRGRLILIALAGIAAAALGGFALATRLVRPIRRLTSTAHHIAATRDLTTPIQPGGNDEIGSLATSFTTMVDSLAASQEQQQRLISDASHEMRTPLTSMRTNLELLARVEQVTTGSLSDADRRAVIDDLQFETNELTALLAELVELATDRSANEEPLEPTDLAELCRQIADRATRRTGREVAVDVVGPPTVAHLRTHAIERAVSNLVDNAVKYSPADGAIEIRVEGGAVTVRDHGAGIEAADLPHVFDRFYRATSARTEPGSGLGLAIVSQIVHAHGGEVTATNHPDGGAMVGFRLPSVDG